MTVSQFLKGEGYDISKSSVGRYATRTNNAMQRLLEAQAQTDRLIQVVKENPEADYTEAAILLTMNGLLNKVATAEEEFNEMPLDKAGRLIASLSRTKVYKDRVKQDMRRKAWRTGVILTKTDIKAEAIGSGKKVRGRRHRNWRPDLIVLDDIENDENVNTPEQRRKLKNWFDKAVSKAGDT